MNPQDLLNAAQAAASKYEHTLTTEAAYELVQLWSELNFNHIPIPIFIQRASEDAIGKLPAGYSPGAAASSLPTTTDDGSFMNIALWGLVLYGAYRVFFHGR